MAWLFQPLLQLIARSTDSEMARQLEFLAEDIPLVWARFNRLYDGWLPTPKTLHPYPEQRFARRYPR